MATLLMLDGFEHGRTTIGAAGVYDVAGGSPASVTTPIHSGARALEISAAAAAESVGYTIAAGNQVVASVVYIRFASLPTGAGVTDQLVVFANGGGNGVLRYSVDDNQFNVTNGSSAASGGPTLAVDTWYRVVCEYDTAGANAVMRAKVNGGTEFSVSTARAAADTTTLRLGTLSAQTYTGYFDDLLISVTDGDYEDLDSWTGHSIESLIPNADGTHNIAVAGDFDSFVGTAFDNSTTNGHTFIGHRPLQAANTADQVIRQELGTTTDFMEFTFENLSASSDTVEAVRVYGTHVQASTSSPSLAEIRLLLADDTEVLTTGSLSVVDSTEDPGTTVNVRRRMTIAPSGGWDRTKVDGLQGQVGFADAAPDANLIDFMVEVMLRQAAAAGPTPIPRIGPDRRAGN